MNIQAGDRVVFIPASCMVVRQHIDHSCRMEGTVVFVHPSHRWFLVEYPASNTLLREGFSFGDLGEIIVKKGGQQNNEGTGLQDSFSEGRARHLV